MRVAIVEVRVWRFGFAGLLEEELPEGADETGKGWVQGLLEVDLSTAGLSVEDSSGWIFGAFRGVTIFETCSFLAENTVISGISSRLFSVKFNDEFVSWLIEYKPFFCYFRAKETGGSFQDKSGSFAFQMHN